MKTHWKKMYNPDYLGAYALEEGQEIVLTIRDIHTEKVRNTDGKEEECIVVYWKEQQKPLILNKTNAKAIQKVCRSPYVEDWIGSQVTIYADTVRAFGETVDAIRIRPFPPKKRDNKIDDLKAAIRSEIPKYNGTDKAEIVAKLKEDAANGTETIETLSAALKKLRS